MGEKLLALTPKRRRFVEEYRIDWNATQAAIRAGYSRKTAQEQGSRLLSIVMVQEALAEVMAEESARTQITVDHIIAETAKLAFLNMDEDDDLPWGLHWRRLTEVKFGGNLRISRCDKCHSEDPRGQA